MQLYCMQEAARAGITAEVSITYQLEPRATARVCGVSCQASSQICARVYESWPGNYIHLYAWYQTRTIRWCRGWGVCSQLFLYPLTNNNIIIIFITV